ncbi:MAG TPA: tetratricopeptide repeat protein [Anaerolineales bacterium]|jgi:predicted ATPase/DNA-binding XRE family transcriptional regulator/Tfp pilus assembly protein PilF
MDSDQSFGQSLKNYRQLRDLTQADLAEQVGCATESIRKMEANRQRPSKTLAARLADILAVDAEDRPEFLYLARRRISAPPLRTLASRGPHSVINLPAQTTPLVGREQDLTSASRLLREPQVRLVTLTGPGGVGKTRVAAQLALDLLSDFQDGVYFVPLANITEAALVAHAITEGMHVRVTDDQFIARFGALFRQRRILLILDNFEHVRPAAALIAELLAVAPLLRILITSRTSLGLYGEHELNIPPLATPDLHSLPPSTELIQYDSVRIFVERTRAVRLDFKVTDANASAVAEICCRLDGLPLALELAAAYGKLLSPNMLLERLKKEPINLSSAASNLPERHSTLRNTIQWSYELLSPMEKSLFQQLSVFSGGCSLEAVEEVCSMPEGSVLTHLGSLLDKSLLQQMDTTLDERRYIMLDTIRAYASEQLHAEKQSEQVRQRHLAYYLKLADENVSRSVGSYPWKWLERLEREIANLRAAIQCAIERRDGEAVVHLCSDFEYVWYELGHPGEAYGWMQAALAQDMNLSLEMRATALRFTGYVLMTMQIDYPRARTYLEDALRLWQELENRPEIADTLTQLGIVTLELGENELSQSHFQECVRIWEAQHDENGIMSAREWLAVAWIRQGQSQMAQEVFQTSVKWWRHQGDLRAEAFALNYLGVTAMYHGNFDLARTYQEQALALWRTIGDIRGVSSSLNALGPVVLHQGNPADAFTFLAQSLTLRWESQDYNGIAWNLERMAEVAIARKQWDRGAQLWGAAQALREKYHSPLFPADVGRYKSMLEVAKNKLGGDAWNASCAAGSAKSIETIVQYALEK